jgi:pimeloyl-ACP methyl ester carboxylesterase
MQTFSYESIHIHYERVGSGQPILLLHGFLEDHSMWNSLDASFTEWGFEAIKVDLPCHGLSRFDGNSCSMADMAMCLNHFLNDLQIDNPFVIGHSMGGYVGLELLRLRPIRLSLLHSNFWNDPESKKRDRDRVINIVKRSKEIFIREAIPHLFYGENKQKCRPVIDKIISEAKHIPANEIAASTIGLRDRQPAYDLFDHHQIDIIHGEMDPILPMDLFESEVAKLGQKPPIHIIPDCGHMSIWESPEFLITTLKNILIK